MGLQQAQALAAAKVQLSHEELQRSRQLMEEARRELEGQPANEHAVGVLATVCRRMCCRDAQSTEQGQVNKGAGAWTTVSHRG